MGIRLGLCAVLKMSGFGNQSQCSGLGVFRV